MINCTLAGQLITDGLIKEEWRIYQLNAPKQQLEKTSVFGRAREHIYYRQEMDLLHSQVALLLLQK